jgi:three-Cys-motif partner protein
MKTKNFFNSLQIWSKRKHRILGKYLVPFSAKVGSISPEIFCVDAFAGQGVYADGSEGSPLLMAHVADEAAGRSKPITLKLINVEAKRKNFDVLTAATQPWVNRGIVKNFSGRFDRRMPEIMDAIGNSPAFVFLDPYGPGPIHLSYLRPLLERSQSITEFIINFNAEGLRRMAEFLNADAESERFRKARLTSIKHVTEILGRDRWKQVFSDPRIDAQRRRAFLVRDYMDTLSQYGYKVAAYPVRESLGAAAKYYLIYCTRHQDGIFLMNGLIRREEDEILKEYYERGAQTPLFDQVEADIASRRQALRNLIATYAEDKKRMTRGTLMMHFINTKFAQYHDTDYRAAVQQLIEEGVLATSTGKSRINDHVVLTYVQPSAQRTDEQSGLTLSLPVMTKKLF